MANTRQITERTMNIIFFTIVSASILILLMIMIFLFMEGIPIFSDVSVKDFIFGKYWYPTSEPTPHSFYEINEIRLRLN